MDMPGVHTHIYTDSLTYKFTLHPWPRIMDSAGKRKAVKWTRRTGRHCRPVLQLPTGQSCSLQQTCDDPGAHGLNRGKQSKLNGAKQLERGQTDEQGSGHGKGEQAHSPLNKALQADTAGGLSAQHRPQRNNQQMAGLAANNNRRQSWPASRRAVQVDGGSAVVLAARKAGADLPTCLYPTYRLCLSLSHPLPLF